MKLKDFGFRVWDNNSKEYIIEIELHKYDKCQAEEEHTRVKNTTNG